MTVDASAGPLLITVTSNATFEVDAALAATFVTATSATTVTGADDVDELFVGFESLVADAIVAVLLIEPVAFDAT